MEKKVITITRQFGSLGRQIARQVAERMGFEYYDRDIIEMEAEKIGEDVRGLLEYEGNTVSPYRKMMVPLGYGVSAKKKKLFEIEKSLILDLSRQKDCVIVGRCSDYILSKEHKKNLLSVFVYAPYGARFNFCVNSLGLKADAVEEYMGKVDDARQAFYKHQTGEDFNSIKYRHLMIDSSSMPMCDVVELICESAKKRFRE